MAGIISQYGIWTYAILFFVIFMESGFVVTPFLPGDSLLYAVGMFAALGSLNAWLLRADVPGVVEGAARSQNGARKS